MFETFKDLPPSQKLGLGLLVTVIVSLLIWLMVSLNSSAGYHNRDLSLTTSNGLHGGVVQRHQQVIEGSTQNEQGSRGTAFNKNVYENAGDNLEYEHSDTVDHMHNIFDTLPTPGTWSDNLLDESFHGSVSGEYTEGMSDGDSGDASAHRLSTTQKGSSREVNYDSTVKNRTMFDDTTMAGQALVRGGEMGKREGTGGNIRFLSR